MALIRRWRTVHPLGWALIGCLAALLALVILFLSWSAYLSRGPNFSDAARELQAIKQGKVKPDSSGRVDTQHHTIYVTRGVDGTLTALWPYNLAHDDNYFEGLLFSDVAPVSRQVVALGPVRGGYPSAPRSFMTHLKVDRKISEHWYHILGKMYK